MGCLQKYYFTKGFFETNGVDIKAGFSTPDPTEAQVKRVAFRRSKLIYVLADPSKFNEISPVSFDDLEAAQIITTKLSNPIYGRHTKIWEVDEQ